MYHGPTHLQRQPPVNLALFDTMHLCETLGGHYRASQSGQDTYQEMGTKLRSLERAKDYFIEPKEQKNEKTVVMENVKF